MFDLIFFLKIHRIIRAMNPAPNVFISTHQARVKKSHGAVCERDIVQQSSAINPGDVILVEYVYQYFEYFGMKMVSPDYARFLDRFSHDIYVESGCGVGFF